MLQSCDAGWMRFESSCYFISQDEEPWSTAKLRCEDMDAHLITINDANENSFVSNEIIPLTSMYTWIGASRGYWYYGGNNTWQWVTKETWNFTSFAPGQPSDDNFFFTCVAIAADGWHDATCYADMSVFHYICEKNI